jgi:energy-coupling factor transporter ATP-binding protein EcfA2
MDRSFPFLTRSDTRLFAAQKKSFRGLRSRLEKLKQSWTNDIEVLERNNRDLLNEFQTKEEVLLRDQASQMHDRIQSWDNELEKHIAKAERELLLSVENEKSGIEKLKSRLASDKADLKREREETIVKLTTALESGKNIAQQTKDNVKAKLENERRLIITSVDEFDEWILLKTGRSISEQRQQEGSCSDEILAVSELQRLAKLLEEQKRSLANAMERLKTNKQVKWLASFSYHAIGPLIAISAAVGCWAASIPILFVGLIATVGSVLLTAIMHYASRPMLSRVIMQMAPEVVSQERACSHLIHQGSRVADKYFQQELQRLSKEHQDGLAKAESFYRESKESLQKKFELDCVQLKRDQAQRRYDLTWQRRANYESTNSKSGPQVEAMKKLFDNQTKELTISKTTSLERLSNQFIRRQGYAIERWEKGSKRTAANMLETRNLLQSAQPDWNSESYSNGTWNRNAANLVWMIGSMNPQSALSNEAEACNSKLAIPGADWPVVFDLLAEGSLVLHGSPERESASDGVMLSTCLRAITSMPAGTVRMTIVDPQGLGKKFSWLMALADIDPALVGDRVWTQPLHIADQMALAARHVEDIIQQSLRNEHRNLYEYNLHAGPMAIPYRLIIWDQFPFGLDDSSWQSLCSIMASGGRCGVGVILRISETHIWPSFADPAKLKEFGMHIRFPADAEPDTAWLGESEFQETPVRLLAPPTSERVRQIMDKHREAVAQVGKVVVSFEPIEIPEAEQQKASAADQLAIPLGISAAGRVQSMKLGIGTAQHVLIAGKTGSGKSSLLHTMITSAAMKYSPDQLRLVLLDFKKGVEFQVYSESELPHADIIGIESKREFGVSTLEYVDRIMHARGEAFREWGVQDLPSLARKKPDVAMPRILIVIDEFQELFVEDDKLSQQASMLMDRIVRQGRSFGIHLVLASQTLGGAYSLPRTTLAQMAVRIALQCDSSDAMLILSEDNTAAERLRHSGQAIYNESGGRIESNQGFQVAYLSKDAQLKRLHAMKPFEVPHDPAINPMGRRVVFEGHKPAVWDERSIRLALAPEASRETGAFAMVLGDSVSIDPPIIKTVNRAAGRNIMVVGGEEATAASIFAGAIEGFLIRSDAMNSGSDSAKVFFLNGIRSEEPAMTKVISRLKSNPQTEIINARDLEPFVLRLKDDLANRIANPDQFHATHLICVGNLSRFRELRRSEEYSFGDDGGATKLDAIFADLLRDGPAVGLHVLLWADSASTLSRWLSRQSMRDIELRIVMQMSSNDSNQLIDSNAANRLEPYVALIQDDLDGKPIKFRPFDIDTLPQVAP